jgi:hypothetical protein
MHLHLHLKDVAARDSERNVPHHRSFIQAERDLEVADRIEHGNRKKVGPVGDKLALEASCEALRYTSTPNLPVRSAPLTITASIGAIERSRCLSNTRILFVPISSVGKVIRRHLEPMHEMRRQNTGAWHPNG